jgi:hypothetical protein
MTNRTAANAGSEPAARQYEVDLALTGEQAFRWPPRAGQTWILDLGRPASPASRSFVAYDGGPKYR